MNTIFLLATIPLLQTPSIDEDARAATVRMASKTYQGMMLAQNHEGANVGRSEPIKPEKKVGDPPTPPPIPPDNVRPNPDQIPDKQGGVQKQQ